MGWDPESNLTESTMPGCALWLLPLSQTISGLNWSPVISWSEAPFPVYVTTSKCFLGFNTLQAVPLSLWCLAKFLLQSANAPLGTAYLKLPIP